MKIIIGTYRADRGMIERCMDSIRKHVRGAGSLVFVDDSGDEDHRAWLRRFGAVVTVGEENEGYARAMDKVCMTMYALPDEHFCFWEEDFVAVAPIDLDEVRDAMVEVPQLCQVVFVRQPWFPNEVEAGSMLEALYKRLGDTPEVVRVPSGRELLVHNMTFSCNPSVWNSIAYKWGWPLCGDSEDEKTRYLVKDDGAKFAFWGDRVVVHHDGERLGRGY